MKYLERLNNIPYLKYAFFFYLLLGLTDTIHHLHSVMALGHSEAIHVVAYGLVLIPTAIIMVTLYLRSGKRMFLWLFLAIAILAIVGPGIYHGGWHHLLKVATHLIINSPSTEISSLFPANNPNLWFYEATGLLEFLFAIVGSYFVYMLVTSRANYV